MDGTSQSAWLVGWLTALILLTLVGWTSARVAGALFPSEGRSVRLSAATAVALWLLTVGFYALAALGWFRLTSAMVGWGALTLLARVFLPAAEPKLSPVDLWRAVRVSLSARRRWLHAALFALLAARLLRGLVAPPLAWDALSYHLPRAAEWIQRGQLGPWLPRPDWWGLYGYFPPGGEGLLAWAMLPFHGDGGLAVAGGLVLLAAGPPAYALARALGADRDGATFAAVAVLFTPAAVNFATGAYVDNVSLVATLIGALFVARALRSSGAADVGVAMAGLGLAAGVKATGLGLLGFGVVAAAAAALRGHWRGLGAVVVALPVVLPAYWVPVREHLSPLYPFTLAIGGTTLLEGQADFSRAFFGLLSDTPPTGWRWLALIVPFVGGEEHLNFGPGAILALPLGLAGFATAARGRASRSTALVLAGVGGLALLAFLAGARGQLAYWPNTMGRFLLPLAAGLLCLGAVPSGPRAEVARRWILACDAVLAVPLGWSEVDVRGVAQLTALALAAAVAGRWQVARPRSALAGAVLALTLGGGGLWWTGRLRDGGRHSEWALAARGRAYDVHPIAAAPARAWPIWEALDGQRSAVVAVAAGWVDLPSNWWLYPLMGRRLQNSLTYVSPLRDGGTPTYRDALAWGGEVDVGAWYRRLREQGVEVVVALAPPPPEAAWMAADPGRFAPLAQAADGSSVAYRVR